MQAAQLGGRVSEASRFCSPPARVQPCRCVKLATRCAAAASSGSAAAPPPSAWVQRCMQRAKDTAVLIGDVPFIPLVEAQRWFEAGSHEQHDRDEETLAGVLAERGRLAGEMEVMASTALVDHEAQQKRVRRLLSYAATLEKEVERARHGMEEAALAAAHEAEEHALLQYQQMLQDLERRAAHEAEAGAHAQEGSLRAEVERLHGLLHAAHGAKKQWRARALQVEAQFNQLRSLIQSSLQATTDAAVWREAEEAAAGAYAPPLPHTSPHIRSSEDVQPADSPVQHHTAAAAQQEAAAAAPGGGPARKVKNGVRSARGSAPLKHRPERSGESLHSL